MSYKGHFLAPSARVPLVYTGNYSLSVGTPLNIFRANSLYDPDYSGIGAQPQGFDEMCALYGRYLVKGCKMSAHCTYNPLGVPVYFIIGFSRSDPTGLSLSDLLIQPYVRYTIMPDSSSNGSTRRLSKYASIQTLFGRKTINTDDDEFCGTLGSDPSSVVFGFIGIFAVSGAPAGNVSVRVVLKQYSEFFGKHNLELS